MTLSTMVTILTMVTISTMKTIIFVRKLEVILIDAQIAALISLNGNIMNQSVQYVGIELLGQLKSNHKCYNTCSQTK